MADGKYNGWTNYETWNVALWLGNEEGSDYQWNREADSVLADKDGDRQEAIDQLARELEDEIARDHAPKLSGCYSDLLTSALSAVDWEEIATGYIDQAVERAGDDDDQDDDDGEDDQDDDTEEGEENVPTEE